MFESFQNKPKDIQDAIRQGDTKYLRAAARSSARVRKENENFRKDTKSLSEAIKAEEEKLALKDATAAEILLEQGEEALEEYLKENKDQQ